MTKLEELRETGGFVGRRSELETAGRVLADQRLLTITGPSGVGKSRFAAKLAEQAGRLHPDAPIAVDLRDSADDPTLPSHGHTGLVVLDDADAVEPARVRALARRLLADCPGVVVVVTSTTRLGLPGEHLLELRPLRFPPRGHVSARAMLEWDAPRLLVDRIRALDPGFAMTSAAVPVLQEICAESDGLPSLLELAAAATRFLSLEAVRDAVRSPDSLIDLLPAARTIGSRASRTVLDGDEPERLLLGVASLLREPVTMDCLTALVDDDPRRRAELVGAFCRLVDRSALVSDPDVDGAFRVMRAVARAALVSLEGDGTGAVFERVDAHLVALLESFADSPTGPGEASLAQHLLHHRRGLERLLTRLSGDPDSAGLAIRLIVRLRRQWSALGLVSHAQVWLERAVATRPQRDSLTAEALRTAGFFAILTSDVRRSSELLAQSLPLASAGDDETSRVPTAFLQALVHVGELDLDAAESLLEEVVERTRRSGRVELLAEQSYFLTLIKVIRGDHERAEQDFQASLAWMRARGNRWGIAHSLVPLSISLLGRGLDERAAETAREALVMMDSFGDRVGLPTCLRLLAVLAGRRGDAGRAAVLLGGAGRMDGTWTMAREAIGNSVEVGVRRALGARQFARLTEQGRRLEHRELMRLALETGDTARALRPGVLTRRESEIAELLVEGHSTAQIAAQLVLSTRTVEGHIQRMLHKLNFRSRSQIAVWMSDQLGLGGGIHILAS
ncbi:LuxR C-terminal-related transcriptional regulator [Herbiconiux sp. UC225_62]|uniref:LuxR C-terminal-related transcriptional regulator n=1 Tax=Herbiconiux sp. UC225_62 TaxID=3350168 RepID=UPI0036D27212